MEEILQLRDKVSAALWQSGENELLDVCMYLKGLDKGEPSHRPRRALIKMAEGVLDEMTCEDELEVRQYLTDLCSFMTELKKCHSAEDVSTEEHKTMADRLSALQLSNRRAGIYPGVHVKQLPIPPLQVAATNVIKWGPCDNAEVFSALFSQFSPAPLPCIIQRCDVAPFTAERIAGNQLTVIDLALVGVLCAMRYERNQAPHVKQQVIAEVLAQQFPMDLCAPAQEALDELTRVVDNVRRLNEEAWFYDIIGRLPAQGDIVGGVWNRAERVWVGGAAIADKLTVLTQVLSHPDSRERHRCLYFPFLLLISFATRGTLSGWKHQQILTELRPLMPAVVEMFSPADVSLTYTNFGRYIYDGDAHTVLQRWLRLVPEAAIRLRLLLARATGSGLIALDLAAQALHEHPCFPWHIVRRLYGQQWNQLRFALRAVIGRIYYGFRRDLGAVPVTAFRQITWIAVKILIAAGNPSLSTYKEVVPDLINEKVVEDLVRDYFESKWMDAEALQCDQTPEELQEVQQAVGEARQHPTIVTEATFTLV